MLIPSLIFFTMMMLMDIAGGVRTRDSAKNKRHKIYKLLG